jgi:hypothetical protein
MSSMFSPRAGKQATGVEGVRAYYLVVSAWPVPTYLDCKCSSCACCEYLSCDVIGRRGHPAPGAHKVRVRPFILLFSQDKFRGIVPKRFRGSHVVAGRCARSRVTGHTGPMIVSFRARDRYCSTFQFAIATLHVRTGVGEQACRFGEK